MLEKFVPLDQIEKMSSKERAQLFKWSVHSGYYDKKNDCFVVQKGQKGRGG